MVTTDSLIAGRHSEIRVVDYRPEFHEAFRELNLAWIRRDYEVEPADLAVLDHPEEHILEVGGEIFIACDGSTVVGTCALVPHEGRLELQKMTVAEGSRGRGIGRLLVETALSRSRSRGAPTLHLETSTKAKAALRLYQSVGFRHCEPTSDSDFTRCDTVMQIQLTPYATKRFEEGQIPSGFLRSHRLKDDVRGELRVLRGTLTFVDWDHQRRRVGPGEVVHIRPGAEHHLADAETAAIELDLFRLSD